jgi:lipid II:glycine glycyltransferase (peptidoglycan interpeptide bridge formation enzyme)
LLFRRLPLGFSIAYAPRPMEDAVRAVASSPSSEFRREIDRVCRRRRAAFCRFEPDGWDNLPEDNLPAFGASAAASIQPRRTIVVDLTESESVILGRMKQKARYNIRLAERQGVIVRAWDDIPAFHQMLHETGRRDGFGVHSMQYYGWANQLFGSTGNGQVLVAEYAGRPLAALMVFARGQRAWYFYGASNVEERHRMPTYLLQWEAMRWAKRQGCLSYDLWGVPDEDEATLEDGFEVTKGGLWGVYRFKRGFGGQLRRSPAAFDVIYMRPLHRLFSSVWRARASIG